MLRSATAGTFTKRRSSTVFRMSRRSIMLGWHGTRTRSAQRKHPEATLASARTFLYAPRLCLLTRRLARLSSLSVRTLKTVERISLLPGKVDGVNGDLKFGQLRRRRQRYRRDLILIGCSLVILVGAIAAVNMLRVYREPSPRSEERTANLERSTQLAAPQPNPEPEAKRPDVISKPEEPTATTETRSAKRSTAFDATEGTRLDPLANTTWDLSSPKTVPVLDSSLLTPKARHDPRRGQLGDRELRGQGRRHGAERGQVPAPLARTSRQGAVAE